MQDYTPGKELIIVFNCCKVVGFPITGHYCLYNDHILKEDLESTEYKMQMSVGNVNSNSSLL